MPSNTVNLGDAKSRGFVLPDGMEETATLGYKKYISLYSS